MRPWHFCMRIILTKLHSNESEKVEYRISRNSSTEFTKEKFQFPVWLNRWRACNIWIVPNIDDMITFYQQKKNELICIFFRLKIPIHISAKMQLIFSLSFSFSCSLPLSPSLLRPHIKVNKSSSIGRFKCDANIYGPIYSLFFVEVDVVSFLPLFVLSEDLSAFHRYDNSWSCWQARVLFTRADCCQADVQCYLCMLLFRLFGRWKYTLPFISQTLSNTHTSDRDDSSQKRQFTNVFEPTKS